jgi:hypothetical protein
MRGSAHLLMSPGCLCALLLLLVLTGMQRRRDNTTRYDFRTRTLSWRVEWRFLVDPDHISSTTAVAAAIGLAPPTEQQQQQGPTTPARSAPTPINSSSSSSSSSPGCLLAVDSRVEESSVLCEVLCHHLVYRPGCGALLAALRPFRDMDPGEMVMLMRKEGCPVSRREGGRGRGGVGWGRKGALGAGPEGGRGRGQMGCQ